MRGARILAVVPAGLVILSLLAWHTASTGFIVAPTEKAYILNTTTGNYDDAEYGPGLHFHPLINSRVTYAPAASEYPWCPNYTPTIRGGYEITMEGCAFLNTADMNWVELMILTGSSDYKGVLNNWYKQTSTMIAEITPGFSYNQFRDYRDQVQQNLFDALQPWFAEKGITLIRFTIPNFDFTNPAVAAAFDDTATSQAREQQSSNLMAIAEQERQRMLFEAETQNLVLNALAAGQSGALDQLGIDADAARAWYLVQRDLIDLLSQNPNVPIVVSVGGQPITLQPTTIPQAVPPQ